VARATLEIADIFRTYGPAWRRANAGHVSLTQLKVMAAIEACRTEALGGHVAGARRRDVTGRRRPRVAQADA
jgi:hypothetical protein